MLTHPANLLLRLALEIVGLVTIGQWAWTIGEGWQKYVIGIGIPALCVAIWGLFGTPDDPLRNKHPKIAIPGRARLTIEVSFFLATIVLMLNMGSIFLAVFYVIALFFNYSWSAERLVWLLRN